MAKRPLRVRLAASLVIYNRALDGQVRFLMGKRSESHVFLPGFYVFPGGALERRDHFARTILPQHTSEQIKALLPQRFQSKRVGDALANAALRETSEETGYAARDDVTMDLRPIARAVTPTGQVRRFNTWFFLGPADNFLKTMNVDNELLDVDWVCLDDLKTLKVHHVTRFVLDRAIEEIENGPSGQVALITPKPA